MDLPGRATSSSTWKPWSSSGCGARNQEIRPLWGRVAEPQIDSLSGFNTRRLGSQTALTRRYHKGREFEMQMKGTIRFLMVAAMLLPAAAPVLAQVAPYGEKTMGDPAQD